jgi:hypothetical protein
LESNGTVEWYMENNLHKRIIDRDDKDVAGVGQLRVLQVTRDVRLGAARTCRLFVDKISIGAHLESEKLETRACSGRTEGSGNANDEAFARTKDLREVDLVARRAFDEVNVGEAVSNPDKRSGGAVEAGGPGKAGEWPRVGDWQVPCCGGTLSCEHDGIIGDWDGGSGGIVDATGRGIERMTGPSRWEGELSKRKRTSRVGSRK